MTAVDTATNESGFSGEVTALLEDRTPPAVPTGLSASPSDEQVILSWEVSTSADLAGYRLYRTVGKPPDTSEVPLPGDLVSESAFTDTSVVQDRAYRYAVTAVDTAGNESALSNEASAYLQPEAVVAEVSRSFGDAGGPGDYRLVALPGAVDQPLSEVIAGEAGGEWLAYWDDGTDFVRYDGSETFAFRRGKGFWLTSRQDWTLQDSIETAPLRDSTTAIPLNDGWTIVANPFGEAVSFSALNTANGGDLEALWPFGGAFSDTSAVFKSARRGRAYYLFNGSSGRDSLQVPHPALTDGSVGASSEKRTLQSASPSAKGTAPGMLALSARLAGEGGGDAPGTVSDEAASTIRVGLAGEREARSLRAPPGGLEPVSLRIASGKTLDGERGEEKRLLMADRRRMEGEGETFRLRLTSRADGPVDLQARGADSLEGQSALLIDCSEESTYDLQETSSVQITLEEKKRRLEVAIGSPRYVEKKREEVLPEEVSLTSYPNPATRRVTVEYALPEAQEVILQVYDVLGRRVATLERGRKKAGRHEASFETSRLASGVYFGRLRAGGQTRTQKITVVR